jgi:hypothetical protein
VPGSAADAAQAVLASVEKLSPPARTAFYALAHQLPADAAPAAAQLALSIVQTNGVAAGPHAVGVFPRMARLNHACAGAFNAVYAWRADERLLVVHALKPIQRGEVRI